MSRTSAQPSASIASPATFPAWHGLPAAFRFAATVLTLAAMLVTPVPARAQDSAGGDGGEPAAAAPVVGTGEIDLRVLQYGLGSRPRPGDWVGVQVELTNRSDQVRDVVVRLSIPDAEGDTGWWERTVVAEPGAKRTVWVYARLPFNSTSATYSITAYEAVERSSEEGGRVRHVAGRQVGATVAQIKRTGAAPVSSATALFGVVGSRAAGLEQYLPQIPNVDFSPTGHEQIELIAGLRVADLPDRWMGLAPLETLVWTAAGPDGEPRDLGDLQAEAIREWVRRGGHLVVVLPSLGQGWLGRRDHLLADIMPAAMVRTLEGVSLDPYRKLITSDKEARLPPNTVVNVLNPDPGAGAFDAIRVIDGPDGQAVAVRRLVGTGAVTVIGLDLNNRSLGIGGGIEADIIWNRVLGKRLDLMSKEEINRSPGGQVFYGAQNRQDRWFDRDIAGSIAMTGKAASGLLLAFFVFLLYWLAAGPAGYFGLRRMGRKHHAWVGFVAIAGVFTAIAWGGANLIKPRQVEARHLTFLDHVYGQSNQRARTWMNLLLPRYGEQRITIGDDSSTEFHHAIASWDTPSAGVGLGSDWKMFPDSRGYPIDARSPDSVAVPSRSTIRQLQVDWAGPSLWRMPTPMLPEGAAPAPLGSEIQLVKRSDPPPGERWWSLHGSLVHELPGALEDVVVVVVLRQGHLNVPPAAALISDVYTARLQRPWEPGTALDLNAVTPVQTGRSVGTREYFEGLVGNPSDSGMMQDDQSTPTIGRDSVSRLTALAFYSMLEPPRTSGPVPEQSVVARRQAAQTWDLGRWFTQPCVIIVGHLVDQEAPVPISVDGEPAKTVGRTVVRWVYPLPADPPRFEPLLE